MKCGLETKYSAEQSPILNVVILAAVGMWKPYRPGAYVVSVNDSRLGNEKHEINLRNKFLLWIIKKLEVFCEVVQLTSEGNIVLLSDVPWRKPAMTKRG